jgi:hypothetical protein
MQNSSHFDIQGKSVWFFRARTCTRAQFHFLQLSKKLGKNNIRKGKSPRRIKKKRGDPL